MTPAEEVKPEESIASTIEEINKGTFQPDGPGSNPENNQDLGGGTPANQQNETGSNNNAPEENEAGKNGKPVESDSGANQATNKDSKGVRNPFFDQESETTQATPENTQQQQNTQQNQAPTEEDFGAFFNKVSDVTNGRINSMADLTKALNELDDVTTKLSAPKEIEFPNERAKEFYEMAVNADNLEGAQADFYKEARLMAIDSDQLPDKEALYQAFLLDADNNYIPESKKREVFELQYNKNYSEINDPDSDNYAEAKLLHEVAVSKAKGLIKDSQKSYLDKRTVNQPTVDPEIAEKNRVINEGINGYWNQSEGIDFDFNGNSENPDPNKVYKEQFSPEKKEFYSEMTRNPNKLIQNKIKEFTDANGNFDVQSYSNWVYLADNVIPMLTKMQSFGYNLGIENKIAATSNAQTIHRSEQVPNATVKTGEPTSMTEAWKNAAKKA